MGRFEVVLEMPVDADGELCVVVDVVVIIAVVGVNVDVVGVGVGVTGVIVVNLAGGVDVDVDVGVVGVEVDVVAAASAHSSVAEATVSNGNDNGVTLAKLCDAGISADSGMLPSRLWRCPLELCLLLRSPELRAGCGSEWCPVMDVGDMGGVRRKDWSEIGLCGRYTGDEL